MKIVTETKVTLKNFEITNEEFKVLNGILQAVTAFCERTSCDDCPFKDTAVCKSNIEELVDDIEYFREKAN